MTNVNASSARTARPSNYSALRGKGHLRKDSGFSVRPSRNSEELSAELFQSENDGSQRMLSKKAYSKPGVESLKHSSEPALSLDDHISGVRPESQKSSEGQTQPEIVKTSKIISGKGDTHHVSVLDTNQAAIMKRLRLLENTQSEGNQGNGMTPPIAAQSMPESTSSPDPALASSNVSANNERISQSSAEPQDLPQEPHHAPAPWPDTSSGEVSCTGEKILTEANFESANVEIKSPANLSSPAPRQPILPDEAFQNALQKALAGSAVTKSPTVSPPHSVAPTDFTAALDSAIQYHTLSPPASDFSAALQTVVHFHSSSRAPSINTLLPSDSISRVASANASMTTLALNQATMRLRSNDPSLNPYTTQAFTARPNPKLLANRKALPNSGANSVVASVAPSRMGGSTSRVVLPLDKHETKSQQERRRNRRFVQADARSKGDMKSKTRTSEVAVPS